MPAQDDSREHTMVALFNLFVPPNRRRDDIDAYLELEGHEDPIPFELKSSTVSSVSTVRDFGPKHIAKWVDLHWLFAFYETDATTLRHCYYASPADMADWIDHWESYVRPDYVLALRAPEGITDADLTEVIGSGDDFPVSDAKRIMKQQWSAEEYRNNADLGGGRYSRQAMLEMLKARCAYVIRRGATLNNPKIPESYLSDRVQPITKDHAATVRELVRKYLNDRAKLLDSGTVPAEDQVDPVVAGQASASATDSANE